MVSGLCFVVDRSGRRRAHHGGIKNGTATSGRRLVDDGELTPGTQ